MRPLVWIGHVELKVDSLPVAEDFYLQLGLRLVTKDETHLEFELRGGTHLLVRIGAVNQAAEVGFDLMVEDIEGAFAAFSEQGFQVSKWVDDGCHESFFVSDPAGNRIQFCSSHVKDYGLV